jgi:hypothetical protein
MDTKEQRDEHDRARTAEYVAQGMTPFDALIASVVDRAPKFVDDQGDPTPAGRRVLEGHRPGKIQKDGPRAGVYFFLSGRFIKIGMSNDVPTRMSALKSSLPDPIRLIAYIPVDDLAERRKREAALHADWSDHRSHGEWFRATPILVKYISDLVASGQAETRVPDYA